MRDTPTPLSIAFFAADGSFVSSADMVPCLDGPDADCARYGAGGAVHGGDRGARRRASPTLGIAAGQPAPSCSATPCEPAAELARDTPSSCSGP